uniref:epidermal growth factor receptor-like n=1 Tax=Ciona intestinalis TaxID=7719 RepID=UPI0000524463|nr:epidermal growth factor receptor-like [Ciona intestinalis]|eukprot:XP_002126842.1 epidermal growth factor receptor-like [Ciona intestinalis]
MAMHFLSTVFFVLVVLAWSSKSEESRRCYGFDNLAGPLAKVRSINSTNIGYFEGCEIVEGNMLFLTYAFKGDIYTHTPPMNTSQLQALSSIKVITGFLYINAWAENVTNFSAFKSLEKIEGRTLFRNIAAIVMQGVYANNGPHYLQQIESLGFASLKSIDNGNVYIGQMQNLCYDKTVDWQSVLKNPIHRSTFTKGLLLRRNKPKHLCNLDFACSECSTRYCWAPGPDFCM